MRTMFNPVHREELLVRIARLGPETPRRWGKMTCPEMVAHLADALRMGLGELTVAPRKLPLRFPPIKQLLIYALPFPKGAPTAEELVCRKPEEWPAEVEGLAALVRRFGDRSKAEAWPDHPAFGKLSGAAWGVLAYRHADHHLRQFGV